LKYTQIAIIQYIFRVGNGVVFLKYTQIAMIQYIFRVGC